MPRKQDRDDEDPKEPAGGRPGPTDQGGNAGMATREVAPELITADEEDEPPD